MKTYETSLILKDNINAEWLKDFKHRLSLGMESVAGYGSSLQETQYLREELPRIFKNLNIKNILDIPCADFFWMDKVDFNNMSYTGADLLAEQIAMSQQLHPEKKFIILDMTQDALPKVDLIFTRDLFIHLNNENIKRCIINVKNSGSKYFMASTYLKIKNNEEMNGLLSWRFINLQQHPFNFTDPLIVIDEKTHTSIGKSMAVWNIENLPNYKTQI